MKAAHWVLDGPIEHDAGDVGGDIQVGPAISVRFRSDDCPEARFEINVYATAKPYVELDEPGPDCPHEPVILERLGNGTAQYAPQPEEHLACYWKPGTVDVQAQYQFRMDGTVDEYGNYDSSNDHVTYEWVGSNLGYPEGTLPEQIRAATKDAERIARDWGDNVNKYLHWDGRTIPKD